MEEKFSNQILIIKTIKSTMRDTFLKDVAVKTVTEWKTFISIENQGEGKNCKNVHQFSSYSWKKHWKSFCWVRVYINIHKMRRRFYTKFRTFQY